MLTDELDERAFLFWVHMRPDRELLGGMSFHKVDYLGILGRLEFFLFFFVGRLIQHTFVSRVYLRRLVFQLFF